MKRGIYNITRNTILAQEAEIADTFLTRLIGLLGRISLIQGQALLITRCRCVHMFFMRFSIDVLFVDKKNYVIGIIKKLRPFRISPLFWQSSYVVELPEGTIEKTKTCLGDQIKVFY